MDSEAARDVSYSSAEDGKRVTVRGQNGLTDPSKDKPYVDHEILVQFSQQIGRGEIAGLLNGSGMHVAEVLNAANLCRVKIPDTLKVEEAVKKLKGIPEVKFSEPNFIVHTTAVPNDASFSSQ
ncbi:MAG: hypothetical protein COZ95_04545, partial [Nitrospirae bacterium CG_4_8_14_3_um_filter_50_41]